MDAGKQRSMRAMLTVGIIVGFGGGRVGFAPVLCARSSEERDREGGETDSG